MYRIQIGIHFMTKEYKKQINFLLHNKRPFYRRENASQLLTFFRNSQIILLFYRLLP